MADELLGDLLKQNPPAKSVDRRTWQATPVRGRDLHDQPQRQSVKSAKVLKQSSIRGTDRILDWLVVLLLWFGSAIGNTAAFNGGFDATFQHSWQPWRWQASWQAVAGGFVMQGLLQWIQFANCHHKAGWKYRLALGGSALPNLYVFWPVLAVVFSKPLVVIGVPFWVAFYAGGIAGAIMVVGLDVLQEVLIIDGER